MFHDLQYALRTLAKTPGFAVVALLTLALGIGVNTSMFTVVNTLLLPRLPFTAPEQLVRVYRTSPQSQSWPHSFANFSDLQAQNHVFSAMAAYCHSSTSYAAPEQPAERLRSLQVTDGFFALLGANAALGRSFTAEEYRPGGAAAIVLSHECWQARFAGDPAVIGRSVRIDGAPATIVGILPAGFVPRLLWGPLDVLRPLVFSPEEQQNRGQNFLSLVARLAPGTSLASAQAEMNGLAARLAADHPETNANSGLRLVPLARTAGDDASRYASLLVLGLAGFVLLIACANLAHLQISRAAARAREHAIRLALGASRWRVMRTLLAESILLGVAGGALGLLLAVWCNELLGRHLTMPGMTGLELSLDLRVFGFALAAACLSAFGSGVMPAWFAARCGVNDTLKLGGRSVVGGRGHQRLRHALIVGELALALVLLAGAGVLIRGLQRINAADVGWQPDNLLTAALNLPGNTYPDEPSRRTFFKRLDDALAGSPLILQAAIASSLPVTHYGSSSGYAGIDGRAAFKPGSEPLANLVFVNPGFFETLGIRLLHGRLFTAEDRADRPGVVVINETMARALFPGENPVGRRIGHPDTDDPTWYEIVGVVASVSAPAELTPPDTVFQTYRPLAQQSFNFAEVAVRGRVPADQLAGELRRIVAAIDPDQPVHNAITARADIARTLTNITVVSRLLGGFALLGLALAALGIYGVLASFVVQRTQEIGVRIALGAQLRDILRLVLGQGLRLSLLGAAIGLLGAFAIARLLASAMPALGVPEPLTLGAVVVGLLAVAGLACWLPARRAARVDAMTALRAE